MSLQAHEREGCPIRVQLSGQADGLERYIRAVERVGAVPVPGICPRPDPGCDALVLCGGGDLDPALFGQENHGSHPPDRERDRAMQDLYRDIGRQMPSRFIASLPNLPTSRPPRRCFIPESRSSTCWNPI